MRPLTQLPLVVPRDALPIEVVEVFVFEGKKIVVPVDGPADAIVHRLVAVCVEVENAEIQRTKRFVFNPPQKSLVGPRCAVPPWDNQRTSCIYPPPAYGS